MYYHYIINFLKCVFIYAAQMKIALVEVCYLLNATKEQIPEEWYL